VFFELSLWKEEAKCDGFNIGAGDEVHVSHADSSGRRERHIDVSAGSARTADVCTGCARTAHAAAGQETSREARLRSKPNKRNPLTGTGPNDTWTRERERGWRRKKIANVVRGQQERGIDGAGTNWRHVDPRYARPYTASQENVRAL